tara:strand:+ start:354 stop:761 length:408 start_codon:yes stop_codon:yes gene_type:complete
MKNDKKIKSDLKENKVALSFREYENKKVLFRLFNTKRDKSKSFNIYEKAKFSTNIKDAFNNDYRKVDIEYDTTKNNRFKKVNLLIDLNSYLEKSKINLYKDLLESNKIFVKENNITNKEIINNISYFEKRINELK